MVNAFPPWKHLSENGIWKKSKLKGTFRPPHQACYLPNKSSSSLLVYGAPPTAAGARSSIRSLLNQFTSDTAGSKSVGGAAHTSVLRGIPQQPVGCGINKHSTPLENQTSGFDWVYLGSICCCQAIGEAAWPGKNESIAYRPLQKNCRALVPFWSLPG